LVSRGICRSIILSAGLVIVDCDTAVFLGRDGPARGRELSRRNLIGFALWIVGESHRSLAAGASPRYWLVK
jgi:hypothetical protein